MTGSVKQQIAASAATLNDTISALAERLDADIADLQDQIDTHTGNISDLADRASALESTVNKLDGLVSVTGSVKQQIAAAIGHPTLDESHPATGLWADIEGAIGEAITSIKGSLGSEDYQTIKDLSDAVKFLEENTVLQSDFTKLLSVLKGRGTLMSVSDASNLQNDQTDPLHILLTNYRLEDSTENILTLSTSDAVFKNAKAVIVSSGDIQNAAEASKLIALGVDLANSTYNVEDTAAHLTDYSTFPVRVLDNATNITATGLHTTADQAAKLFAASNNGLTTVVNLTLTAQQSQSLELDVNDVIETLTVTGVTYTLPTGPTIIDLSSYVVTEKLNFAGKQGSEVVIISAVAYGSGNVGVVELNGGAGNDYFVIVEPVDSQGDTQSGFIQAGSGILGGQGQDTLLVSGQVDISGIIFRDQIETLMLQTGSPSTVTMTAAQLAMFGTIQGALDDGDNAVSTIVIAGQDSETTASFANGATISGVQTLQVGQNVTVSLTAAQLSSIVDIQPGVVGSEQKMGAIEVAGGFTTATDLSAVHVGFEPRS